MGRSEQFNAWKYSKKERAVNAWKYSKKERAVKRMYIVIKKKTNWRKFLAETAHRKKLALGFRVSSERKLSRKNAKMYVFIL